MEKISKTLPKFLKKYFWDTKLESLDIQKNQKYIIERILEIGDMDAIGWMKKNYPQKTIVKTFKKGRTFSAKSANFWSLIYQINPRKVLCLNESYQEKRKRFWPY